MRRRQLSCGSRNNFITAWRCRSRHRQERYFMKRPRNHKTPEKPPCEKMNKRLPYSGRFSVQVNAMSERRCSRRNETKRSKREWTRKQSTNRTAQSDSVKESEENTRKRVRVPSLNENPQNMAEGKAHRLSTERISCIYRARERLRTPGRDGTRRQ